MKDILYRSYFLFFTHSSLINNLKTNMSIVSKSVFYILYSAIAHQFIRSQLIRQFRAIGKN